MMLLLKLLVPDTLHNELALIYKHLLPNLNMFVVVCLVTSVLVKFAAPPLADKIGNKNSIDDMKYYISPHIMSFATRYEWTILSGTVNLYA